MRNFLFTLLTLFIVTKATSQCTVATNSYSSNFDSNTNNLLPTCWTTPYTNGGSEVGVNINGQGVGGSVGYIYLSNSVGGSRHFVMPKVTNANGILSLTAKRAISGNTTPMEIGIMTDPNNVATFSVMASYNLPLAYTTYNVNLANYTGTGQYIAVKSYFSNTGTVAWIDNVSYNAFSGSGPVIYVDKDAIGLNNGTSWTDAYTDLNNALTNSTFNVGQEMWIADGTYKPHAIDRNIAFTLPHNAKIYGGFSGTETLKSQRNPSLYPVILSGDLSGNDNAVLDPTEATRQDNSYHIFSLVGEKRDIIVDGVTLSGANANGTGNENTASVILMTHIAANNLISVDFSDVIIENNTATNAAIFQAIQFATQGSTSILNLSKCTVRNNKGNSVLGNMLYVGHRTYNQKTYGTILNSLFYKNTCASGTSSVIYNKVNGGSGVVTPIYVRNCTFSNNSSTTGNVVYLNSSTDSKFSNNIFYGNGNTTPVGWVNSGVIASVFNNCISEDPAFGLNQNPLFKDAANNDYHFDCSGNSPAINAGNSTGISVLEKDFDGNSRLVGTVDIGALEYRNRISTSASNISVCLGNNISLTANYGTGISWSSGITDGVPFTPTISQNYTVTGINENGCADQAVSVITVKSPTFSINSGSICLGKSFTITPTGATSYTIEGNTAIKTPTTTTTYTVLTEYSSTRYAINFDGTNDYLSAAISPSFNYNLGYSYEAWVKLDIAGAGASRAIFFTGTSASSNIEIYTQSGSNYLVVVHNRGIVGFTSSGQTFPIPPINTWFHLAVTYDGSAIKVYYDGVLKTPNSTIAGSPLQKSIGAELSIGYMKSMIGNPGFGFSTLKGKTEEVRVWNNVRTQSEILANKNNCVPITSTGLVNYYPFLGGSGVNSVDEVSGNNLTLNNMNSSNWEAATNVSCSNVCAINSILSSSITVNQLPNIGIVSNNTLLCVGETTSLTANGATSYTWNTASSNTIISISPTVTTSYSVIGTDDNGCKNTSTITQSVSICTDIQQIEKVTTEFNIFPNPATSLITIQSNEVIETITVFNVAGCKVKSETKTIFSVDELSSGMYFLQISTKNGMVTKRFIKE